MNPFCERLGLAHLFVQAPMAGVSTPTLALAVAGALGSLATAALPTAKAVARQLAALAATDRPLHKEIRRASKSGERMD